MIARNKTQKTEAVLVGEGHDSRPRFEEVQKRAALPWRQVQVALDTDDAFCNPMTQLRARTRTTNPVSRGPSRPEVCKLAQQGDDCQPRGQNDVAIGRLGCEDLQRRVCCAAKQKRKQRSQPVSCDRALKAGRLKDAEG